MMKKNIGNGFAAGRNSQTIASDFYNNKASRLV